MKRKIYNMMFALLAIASSATAQSLSVQPIEVGKGEETQMVVSLSEGTTMTALQFNLQMPDGISVDATDITLGSATDGHTLKVESLDSGDLLFIIYSMDLNAFKDGELLSIPLTASNKEMSANGKLYTVRTATVDAVSHTSGDAAFDVKVVTPEGIEDINTINNGELTIFDLQGRIKNGTAQKGINIIKYSDGTIKKIMTK